MFTAAGQHCVYIRLPNGIHQFEFKDTSRASLDEWLAYLGEIYQHGNGICRILMDMSRHSHIHSPGYTLRRGREWQARHPGDCIARIAYLHNRSANVSFVAAVFKLLRLGKGRTVRFFPDNQREAAIMWLLGDSA